MEFVIYGLIYLGSALMIYNIIGFIRFARMMKSQGGWTRENKILYIPIILLAFFLAGYLAVGIFGKPDFIISGILFGGSVFVFVMYLLLDRIAKRILENERLEAQLMAAKESNRAKTVFLSGISHEMRTPLNVILGLNTLSLNDPSLSDETRSRTEKINQSAQQLLGIVNNILDLNSLETGEFLIKKDAFSLLDLIGQVSAITNDRCAEKGLDYRRDIAPGVCEGWIGDDMRLKQILLTLLDNAVKYTDAPGQVVLKVRQNDARDGSKALVFAVEDSGTGIDPEFLSRIFDLFAKEDTSTTSSHGGSGLGLAVTKRIVDFLGGTIRVESEKGVGSVFTVAIPMETAPLPREKEEEPAASLEGKRILIVEDVPENAEIVADLLELEGAQSEHAENGKIALDMFVARDPGYYDAILMDLRMPVMDGITAAKEIRRSKKADAADIPIIALTANAFESDVKESLGAGMNAHLSKPTDSEKMYATLKKYIKNHSGKGEKAL
ncbi:MAG: ATP-binding protein [Oscillospiraceae bacterium]